MKTNRYTFVLLLLLCSFTLHAQTYLDQLSIENISIERQADVVSVAFDVNLDELRINRNHLLQITPIISSADGQQSVALSPVYVIGRTRYRVLNRPFTWTGKTELSDNALAIVVRRNRTNQLIRYTDILPFENWKRDARLWLRTEIIGCADCFIGMEEMSLNNRIFPDRFVPNFRMTLIEPEIPQPQSEQHSAMLNFPVGRHELLPDFGNNAAVLAEVDRVIRNLQANENLTIIEFAIAGFASPEGSQASNLLLSQRRAETFARFIEQAYGFTRDQIRVEWFGEDWDGLRRAVAASQLPNRDAIIHIIDTEPNFDARDALLIALDNGQTYSRLLREFYPPLRRNDYRIVFISHVPAIDEATAHLNAAVTELQGNNPEAAIARLERISTGNAAAYNLWGIAFAMQDDVERARIAFNRALQKGCVDAHHNLEQLEKYITDNI